jgi:hypothetical protein
MLRLVHPQREGQDPPSARRKGRRATALNLTLDEVQCVRAALRNLARAHGSWGYLAMVMGVPVKSLYQVAAPKGKRPSVAMVLLAARAGGTTVEQILSGKIAPVGRCLTCGRSQTTGDAR